jgi:hypothetical protein
MKEEIILDSEFKIVKCGGNFILMQLSIITSGKNEGETKWKEQGYHGSMISALRGYIRHSIDTCATIEDIVKRIEILEDKQKVKK